MTGGGASIPPGYARVATPDGTEAVALGMLAAAVAEALAEGELYSYAAHHPAARMLAGRGVAYAVPLPDGETRVVVRRSRHGGVLAPFTGELFLGRARAPRELETALRLARLGVPTPDVLAYATYAAGPWLRRVDVLTREVADALDLGAVLVDRPDRPSKAAALQATATLLARLTAAGARHPDLNVKNVLLAPDANGDLEAWVIDVDRVWFDEPGAPRVTDANLRRLARSARKWRRLHGADVDDGDVLWLAGAVDAGLDGRRSEREVTPPSEHDAAAPTPPRRTGGPRRTPRGGTGVRDARPGG